MDIDASRDMGLHAWGLHWWAVVIRGIIAVVFGVLALVWPGITLGALLMIFGIFVFADGILAIIAAFGTAEGRKRWLLLLLVGIAGIAASFVTFTYPILTVITLLYIIGIWAVVIGVLYIATAFAVPGEIAGRWLWGISGILSIIFGLLLFKFPGVGLLSVVFLIGFYAIVYGFAQVMLGLHIKGFGQHLRGALQH